MTREDAINNLNMISVAFVEPVSKEQRKLIDDTFDMAINALEQLTSYEQTINKLTKAISEQEPKSGHWEYVQYDYNPRLGNWHCSECRCVVIECVDKNEKGGIPLYKYCPQCGARMESEE